MSDDWRESIRSAYRGRTRKTLPLNDLTAAAVLIPLFEKEDEIFLLLARRTEMVRTHKGQIAFPGGAQDVSDRDLAQTALRETEEEIGIPASEIRILGELDDYPTPTKFRITPYVGTIPYPYAATLNRDETEAIIEFPLGHLMRPQNHRKGFRRHGERTYDIHFFDYGEHTVWGATGLILYDLLDVIRPLPELRKKVKKT